MKGSSQGGERKRLAHRLVNARHRFDGLIEQRIRAGGEAAHQAEIASFLEAGDQRAQPRNQLALLRRPVRVGDARNRGEDVDRRKSALVGDRAIKHDMAVERAANAVGDRIVVVVAIDQNRKHPGDRAGILEAGSGAFEEARQVRKHARRVTARHGRFARRQRDVARRMGEAGDQVDDQQHLVAKVAKILGDRHRGARSEPAHHRALVAGGDDRNRRLAIFGKGVVKEFAHFATALADQRDHDGVEIRARGRASPTSSICRRPSRRRRRCAVRRTAA